MSDVFLAIFKSWSVGFLLPIPIVLAIRAIKVMRLTAGAAADIRGS